MGCCQIIKETRWVIIVNRGDCNVDYSSGPIEGFLESIKSAVVLATLQKISQSVNIITSGWV
jgi:hypothetical protein